MTKLMREWLGLTVDEAVSDGETARGIAAWIIGNKPLEDVRQYAHDVVLPLDVRNKLQEYIARVDASNTSEPTYSFSPHR